MLSEIEKLLIHNTLNEVLHGLSLTPEVSRLMEKQVDLAKLYKDWDDHPSIHLAMEHRELLEDVIRVVIQELGIEEFYTRTGVEIKEATNFIERLRSRY